MTTFDPDVLAELTPTGRLRAAINLGNPVLAQRDEAGTIRGITADLSRELAARANVPLELVPYPAAGKVFEDLQADVWDIAYLAIEPVRAAEIAFTPPYVLIEGAYLVATDSPLKAVEDVDREGIRIAVGGKSAYDLYLTRTIKHATLVRSAVGGGIASVELFRAENLDVAAGVRQPLVGYAQEHPDVRVMDGKFMDIQQAMGVAKSRIKAAAYLKTFIEEMKASGFVADSLRRSGQHDAAVAPPASS